MFAIKEHKLCYMHTYGVVIVPDPLWNVSLQFGRPLQKEFVTIIMVFGGKMHIYAKNPAIASVIRQYCHIIY